MRTIYHLSDVHFGADDPPVVEGLIADVASLASHRPPDVLVLSGDFTQRARAGQYRAASAFVGRLPAVARVFVPGNHDIPLYDVLGRFFRTLANYKHYITHDLRPEYADDELLVLGLNTARPLSKTWDGFWKDGRISRQQLRHVAERAASASASAVKVLVTHHPFIPPPAGRSHGIVLGAKRALAVLESSGFDLLLAGHLHMNYRGDVRGYHEATRRSILSIQAGTACSTRRRDEPNAWNRITIDPPDEVTVEARAWDGRAFAASERETFRRSEGVWEMTHRQSLT